MVATVEVERAAGCPHCGAAGADPHAPCRDRLHGLVDAPMEYARCRGCGVVYLALRPDPRHLDALYPSDYAPYAAPAPRRASPARRVAAKAQGAFHRLVPDAARRRLAAWYEPPFPGATLVDFGCGSPAFLEGAARRGWRPVGVDFAPGVVGAVRGAGFEAHLVDECWDALAPGSVAAVRMNHVLEHLYEPRATLDRLARLVEPGGRLHVAVPNPAGVGARLFGQDWRSLDARHVVLYDPARARRLLEDVGFSEVRVVHETVTRDLVGSWAHRRARRAGLPAAGAEARVDGELANLAALVPAKLAALARRSDRIHLLAHR